MSGRVRWVRPGRGHIGREDRRLLVDGHEIGNLIRLWGEGVRAIDVPSGERRTLSRRSDAKRWLLARAAGLAEVPRRPRFRVYDGTRWRLASIVPDLNERLWWAGYVRQERNGRRR